MILVVLVGHQLSINPVKSELNWLKGSGGDSILSKLFTLLYFSSVGHIVHRSGTVLAILVQGH